MSITRATAVEWLVPASGDGTTSVIRDRAYEIVKRGFDIAAASLLLILTAPILLIAIIAVRATSPGRVFFRQSRAGRNGVPFQMYKLRTMVASAEDDKELFRRH